ncbi:GNAT family N-acetyltransferase [Sphingobacterium hungaricum]|uniref:GNAT family N-acetyltransferase n=1 Tax=Sphingobacterium hungaricum TaxID=2082723 RepID=A0A928YPT5_9SPHI|nr:GNAT family N-acetyltransferase [Sphingobacterium hungaricum]MBE8713501.1 GNAT family N-acetyltransferase [Sphingobacterium hungaricum]
MAAANKLEVKKARLENIDELALLFDAYRVFYQKDSDLALAKSFLTERLANSESIVFIAYFENKAVAFTQLYPKYSSARAVKNWILNDLYVDENYRKLGIASQLIQQAMEFVESTNASFVQLETAVDNYNAQKLYKKMGFEIQSPDSEFLLYRKAVQQIS